MLLAVSVLGATPAQAGPAAGQAGAGQDRELRQRFDRRQEGSLQVGDLAPDFVLQDVEGKTTVTLSARRGRPVVLVFGSCT